MVWQFYVNLTNLWYLVFWSNTSLDVAMKILFYTWLIFNSVTWVKQITLHNVDGHHSISWIIKRKTLRFSKKGETLPLDHIQLETITLALAGISSALVCLAVFKLASPYNHVIQFFKINIFFIIFLYLCICLSIYYLLTHTSYWFCFLENPNQYI